MSNRSLEGSRPKDSSDEVRGGGGFLRGGDVGLDLLDLLLGQGRLVGRELEAVAPEKELRRFREGGPEAPLERLQIPVGHRQLGQARIVVPAHGLGRGARAGRVGRQEDLGLRLFHVVDVLAERPAADVIDFEHFPQALVERFVDDGQDDGALERLHGLGADGQRLVVFLVDRIADLVGAGRVVELDFLDALAGGLAEGELFGQLPDRGRLRRRGQLQFEETDIVRSHLDEGVVVIHFSFCFPSALP